MITHADVIGEGEGKGPAATAAALWPHLPSHHWENVEALANAIKGWRLNDSIPGRYWPAFERAALSTVVALAAAAEAKPKPAPKSRSRVHA